MPVSPEREIAANRPRVVREEAGEDVRTPRMTPYDHAKQRQMVRQSIALDIGQHDVYPRRNRRV